MVAIRPVSNGDVSINDIIDVRLPNDGNPTSLHGELKVYKLPLKEIYAKYGPPRITKYKLMQLIGEGNNITKIGKILGISGETVSNLIKRYGIDVEETKKRGQIIKEQREELIMGPKLQELSAKLSKEQFVKYMDEGKSVSEIGKMVGIGYQDINHLKRFYCLTTGTKGKENEQGFNKDMLPKDAGGNGWGKSKKGNDSTKNIKTENRVNSTDDAMDKVIEISIEELKKNVASNSVNKYVAKNNTVENSEQENKETNSCSCNNFKKLLFNLGEKLSWENCPDPEVLKPEDFTDEEMNLLWRFGSIARYTLRIDLKELTSLAKKVEELISDNKLHQIHHKQMNTPIKEKVLESVINPGEGSAITLNIENFNISIGRGQS